jgi:hypothetical protein
LVQLKEMNKCCSTARHWRAGVLVTFSPEKVTILMALSPKKSEEIAQKNGRANQFITLPPVL